MDNTAKIFGTKGWAELPEYWKARKLVLHLAGQESKQEQYPCAHELTYEARHIQNCLRLGLLTSPVVTEKISVDGIAALENIQW